MTITQKISALPPAPDPVIHPRTEFAQVAAASVLAQRALPGELNSFADQANALAADVTAKLAATNSAAATAEAAAQMVAVAAGAVPWVSGTTYARYALVFSPANAQVYRRRVAGAGTTDPSLDPINWALPAGDGAFIPQPIPAGSINLTLGNYHSKTINGNQAFTLDNCPSVGFSVVIRLTVTSGIVSLPTSVVTPDSVPYTLTAGRRHLLLLVTENNGAGWMMAAATNYPV